MLNALIIVGVVLLLCAALYAAAILLKPQPGKPRASAADEPPPYQARRLLTRAEADFYKVLRLAVGPATPIFAQVPLGALLSVRKGTQEPQKWRNKVDRKTIDFVVCHTESLDVLFLIELDDRSHESDRRRHRDDFVERVLSAAGLRLVRVPVQRSGWAIEDLRTLLLRARGG